MKILLLGFVVLHSFFVLGESHTDIKYFAVFKCIPENQRIDFSKPYGIEISNFDNTVKKIVLDSDISERGCHLKVSINEAGFSGVLLDYVGTRVTYPFGYMSGLSEDLICESERQFFRTPVNLAYSAPHDLLDFCFTLNHPAE